MTTLLVDNYDSYTYNVFHLLAAASGEEPIVVHNDMVSWRALSRYDFDAIVLSPGPGHPARWHDFGVCADILRSSEVPVLGVCLGHQGLGHVLNQAVTSAPVAMHGRLSNVRHTGAGLFEGIPQGFSVVRYHSLAVSRSLGAEGRVTAWTQDGVVMGIEHARRPLWGVQFHPESVATEHGHRLVENFYALARERKPPRRRRMHAPLVPPRRCRRRRASAGTALKLRTLDGEPSTELLFERLFGACEHAFWLDSAPAASPGGAPTQLGQCSYLGTSAGPEGCVLEYDVDAGVVLERRAHERRSVRASIFDVLGRELERLAIAPPAELARGLVGGYVGYLGYECKADCGSANVHRSDVPDAVLMLANRVIAVDHTTGKTHLLALHGGEERDAERWLQRAELVVRELLAAPAPGEPQPPGPHELGQAPVVFRCGRGREQYLADIARCQVALNAGESYEVCLTDQIHTDASPDPWRLYRLLRRRNPAPFAAYLRLGRLTVLSSSPERFLSVDRERRVQARPIKGTAPRAADSERDEQLRRGLLEDEKTFAEHLMIVDLLRNDLGRVCEIDSVRVPDFMVVERYATVHQLISNVTGLLELGRTSVDCVRACFPGGSMTGAPKLRTMEIIDDIEREARGVYSGAIGYFGLDGSVDLSIVIRTVVMRAGGPRRTTIGAGGAIVTQSDAQEEFDELLLKARAPMAAIAEALTGDGGADAWTVQLEPAPRPASLGSSPGAEAALAGAALASAS
ncbi:MAG TPA: aminodeoxychorismate synthase component I [Solirubrobacteraceae bacterium]|nr:aminodeoxychorismate synthase component I [Solirubrobacteraceae bacterium]